MVEKGETKEVLLTTAIALIWGQSYGSVSVDEICKSSGVQKGSFYYFFPSKAELTIAAMEQSWEAMRPELDHIFSPQVPALERLASYFQHSLELQQEKLEEYGYVVGCPYMSVGSEQCSKEDGLRSKANEILDRTKKYFVIALRDTNEEGTLQLESPENTAEELFTMYMGAVIQCRIANKLEPLQRIRESYLPFLRAASKRVTNH